MLIQKLLRYRKLFWMKFLKFVIWISQYVFIIRILRELRHFRKLEDGKSPTKAIESTDQEEKMCPRVDSAASIDDGYIDDPYFHSRQRYEEDEDFYIEDELEELDVAEPSLEKLDELADDSRSDDIKVFRTADLRHNYSRDELTIAVVDYDSENCRTGIEFKALQRCDGEDEENRRY